MAEALGFEALEERWIAEYSARAVLYRHRKTGAQLMSVQAADENKVFGITFRTPVDASTGIPHILEHSVLCGSRKYPLKEPFMELIKGSLQTFVNAFTYPDRTCYPVASTNTQDFYNLVDVYLDAVFFPNCVRDEQIFQQEGWHYELEAEEDPVTFKGVVFNEMKGVYSQPDSLLQRTIQQSLFPNTTYAVDSGGDPRVIPQLTFPQFQEFHGKFYHPSNSRLWFYGDDDPEQRLRVAGRYLEQFEASRSAGDSAVAVQALFSAPRSVRARFPAGEAAGQRHMVCLAWLLSAAPLTLEEQLALEFLDHLLLGTPAAPLRKTLLESGLGEAIVGGGLDDDLQQPVFAIGLKGVAGEKVREVEELVLATLQKYADEGFPEAAVEASINTIEFSLRENNTGSFPRGLALMLRSMGSWIYERSPFEPLEFNASLEHLKSRLAAEGSRAVFAPLLRRFLLENTHRVSVELEPDAGLGEEVEQEEAERLAAFKSALSAGELAQLMRDTAALRERQETPDPPEALQCVPSLTLQDLPAHSASIPFAVSTQGNVTILRHELPTSGILYCELALDLRHVPEDLLPLLPLFCQSLQEMGTAQLSFVELNQLIGRKTGGISVYPMTSARRGASAGDFVSFLIVRGKAMAAQAPDLLHLMSVLLQEVQLGDRERFRQFVAQSKQRMQSRLTGGGQGFAATRIDAMDNVAGWVAEQMGGLSYYNALLALEARLDHDWAAIAASLDTIRAAVVSQEGCIVNLTGDAAALGAADARGGLDAFLAALPTERKSEQKHVSPAWSSILPARNEALIIPTQVNYVGKGSNLYRAGYSLKGSAYVISKHISSTWLWDRVRVSGGAYGGFCDFDSHSGMFTYMSYRDPNLLATLEAYDGTPQFLRELQVDGAQLTRAIIGTISDVDSYQLPDAKGYSSLMRHMLGISDEERQQRRHEILTTRQSDFREFGDVLESVRSGGVVCAVASAGDVKAANDERPGLLHAIPVL